MPRSAPLAALLAGLVVASAEPASPPWRLDVVTDMTAAGRQAVRPTPGHPAYYISVEGGYREMGAVVAGQDPPPIQAMQRNLTKALAGQGYLLAKIFVTKGSRGQPETMAFSRVPSLVVVSNWGYLNPIVRQGTVQPDQPYQVVQNEKEMLGLAAGDTLTHLPSPGWLQTDAMLQEAEQPRYFVVVSAYEAKSYLTERRKVLLWTTKMSLASAGVTMRQVMPTLIAGGAPLLGRETRVPKWINLPSVPGGTVILGAPELKDYLDVPPTPDPTARLRPLPKN